MHTFRKVVSESLIGELMYSQYRKTANIVTPTSSKGEIEIDVRELLGSTKSLFAVIAYESEQYKISSNDVIMLPRLSAQVGEEVAFKKCLLVGGEAFTAIGRPFLDNVRVTAVVEEHKKSHNVIYYLDRHKRKNITWRNSQNQVTIIRIKDVFYEPEVIGRLDKDTGIVNNL